MVYCGKASQGCQSCRKRRIKCDMIKPECSQCLRLGKSCPGYRDQLSLMFRDESTKVIQKAQAQWGQDGMPDDSTASSSRSSKPSRTSSLSSGPGQAVAESSRMAEASRQSSWQLVSPATTQSTSPSLSTTSSTYTSRRSASSATLPRSKNRQLSSPDADSDARSAIAVRAPHFEDVTLYSPPVTTLDDRGVQFYINKFLVGHPDEPKTVGDLSSTPWLWDPALQHVMAAVGLAGLSNLTDNKEMMALARQKYGQALRHTGELIRPSVNPSFEVTMRSVVMLALFEVVKGPHQATDSVQVHVAGGAALLRSWMPMPIPYGGYRHLMQLCYSMFIILQANAMELPPSFVDWITYGSRLQDPIDKPANDLAFLIARFVQHSAWIQRHVLVDGDKTLPGVLGQLLKLDADLAAWAAKLSGVWLYRVEKAPELPSRAIFGGQYHVYHDVWFARNWNFYRWARILTNQTLLELADRYPASSQHFVLPARRDLSMQNMRLLSKDILTGTPSHWRHPLLKDSLEITVDCIGGGGSGAAGLAVLLFQLKTAGCAPGVPLEYWQWAHDILQTIWGDLGMLHARSMMEVMRDHRDTIQRTSPGGVLSS